MPAEMTYEIVDLDGGDVLGTFAEVASAVHRARVLIEESPEIAHDVAIVAINRKGERVGEPFMIAAALAGEQTSPHPTFA